MIERVVINRVGTIKTITFHLICRIWNKDVDYQQAMWAMALGDWEPSEKHKKEYVNSTFGANNLFKNDMVAVVGSNLLETTINVVPFGKFAESAVMIPIVGKGTKISTLFPIALRLLPQTSQQTD